MLLPNSSFHEMFGDAGIRPGSRATFVSAKVAKTIDAQFVHILMGRTQDVESGPTRYARTRPAN
jgi:hypothetical protein